MKRLLVVLVLLWPSIALAGAGMQQSSAGSGGTADSNGIDVDGDGNYEIAIDGTTIDFDPDDDGTGNMRLIDNAGGWKIQRLDSTWKDVWEVADDTGNWAIGETAEGTGTVNATEFTIAATGATLVFKEWLTTNQMLFVGELAHDPDGDGDNQLNFNNLASGGDIDWYDENGTISGTVEIIGDQTLVVQALRERLDLIAAKALTIDSLEFILDLDSSDVDNLKILKSSGTDGFLLQRFDTTWKDAYEVVGDTGAHIAGDGTEGDWTWDGATGDIVFNSAGQIVFSGATDIKNLSGGITVRSIGTLTLGGDAANQFDINANNTITARVAGQPFKLAPLSTFGVQFLTAGSKVTCDSGEDGSLFHENTDADTTAGIVYMCMEDVGDSYAWVPLITGDLALAGSTLTMTAGMTATTLALTGDIDVDTFDVTAGIAFDLASDDTDDLVISEDAGVDNAVLLLGTVDLTIAAVSAGVDEIEVSATGVVITTGSSARLTIADALITAAVAVTGTTLALSGDIDVDTFDVTAGVAFDLASDDTDDLVITEDAGVDNGVLLLGTTDLTIAAVGAGVDEIEVSSTGVVITTGSSARLTIADAAATFTVPLVRAGTAHHLDIQASSARIGSTAPGFDATVGCAAFDADAEELLFDFHIPSDWDGASDFFIDIHWHAESGTAVGDGETNIFVTAYRSIAVGETVTNGTQVTETDTRTQSGAGTNLELYTTRVVLDYNGVNQPLTVDDIVFVSFKIDFSTQTYAADTAVCDFDISYTSIAIPEH